MAHFLLEKFKKSGIIVRLALGPIAQLVRAEDS